MSSSIERSGERERRGPVRAPQNVLGGLALVALAALALYLTRDLPQGTLRAMGPAMLPRWLAIGVALCGIALVVAGFLRSGEAIERSALRGPVFVVLAILLFAVTIRPFALFGITTPGLGMVFAAPLAILVGGFATDEVRWRDLMILALGLTPFCMILFGDALGLAIPMFPQAFVGLFPADWSQKMILRTLAAILALAAVVVWLTTRRRGRGGVDVADHSGRI